jgi:hypothetical protein
MFLHIIVTKYLGRGMMGKGKKRRREYQKISQGKI